MEAEFPRRPAHRSSPRPRLRRPSSPRPSRRPSRRRRPRPSIRRSSSVTCRRSCSYRRAIRRSSRWPGSFPIPRCSCGSNSASRGPRSLRHRSLRCRRRSRRRFRQTRRRSLRRWGRTTREAHGNGTPRCRTTSRRSSHWPGSCRTTTSSWNNNSVWSGARTCRTNRCCPRRWSTRPSSPSRSRSRSRTTYRPDTSRSLDRGRRCRRSGRTPRPRSRRRRLRVGSSPSFRNPRSRHTGVRRSHVPRPGCRPPPCRSRST